MPNLLVKEIGADLLREVNYAASGEGMTQRQWVLKVLLEAVHGNEQRAAKRSVKKDYGEEPTDRGGQGDIAVQPESRAVDSGVQPNPRGKGKSQGENKGLGNCPRCDKPLIAWGNGKRCENCQRNYP